MKEYPPISHKQILNHLTTQKGPKYEGKLGEVPGKMGNQASVAESGCAPTATCITRRSVPEILGGALRIGQLEEDGRKRCAATP
jgi:hypothetical protein